MKTTITFEVDADRLDSYNDQYIAQLWHISQANPAPYGDRDACDFAEHVAREIVRRFLAATAPELWVHHGHHIAFKASALQPLPQVNATIEEGIAALLNEGHGSGFFTMVEIIDRMGFAPGSISIGTQGAILTALKRAGFQRTKMQMPGENDRKWGWRWMAPICAGLPQDQPAPHPAPDTPASPLHASHPGPMPQGPQQPHSPQPAVLPGQIELHQSSFSCPPHVDFKDSSLAAAEGGAA